MGYTGEEVSHVAVWRAGVPEGGNCKGHGSLSGLNVFREQSAFVVTVRQRMSQICRALINPKCGRWILL